jgi:hypothetical protein
MTIYFLALLIYSSLTVIMIFLEFWCVGVIAGGAESWSYCIQWICVNAHQQMENCIQRKLLCQFAHVVGSQSNTAVLIHDGATMVHNLSLVFWTTTTHQMFPLCKVKVYLWASTHKSWHLPYHTGLSSQICCHRILTMTVFELMTFEWRVCSLWVMLKLLWF